ncbi:hypothetical protein SBV45_02665 [Chlamydia crocodili]|uniref:hypothetical protein n=1 Tax=Chlamydia crocodili TaxID=2766982 RepID=UPI003D50A2C0
MKCVPSCCVLNLEKKDAQCCDVSESRARKVANIISILLGVLILSAGIVGVVLFGAELGMMYSILVIGLSVAVGFLLLTVGASCLTCRALISKARASGFVPVKKYIDEEKVLKLKQNISENKAVVASAEDNLNSIVSKYQKAQDEHKKLLTQKTEAKSKLENANQEMVRAKNNFESASEKFQKQIELISSSGGGGGTPSSKEKSLNDLQQEVVKAKQELANKTTAYQEAQARYNTILQQIEDIFTLVDVQLVLPACNKLQEALCALVTSSSSLIDVLEARIIGMQTEMMQKTNRILELERKVQELESKGQSHDGLVKELNTQINSLRKEKVVLEEAQEKKIRELLKEKEKQINTLTTSIKKLQNEKTRGVLETKMSELERELQKEKTRLEEKEKELSALQKKMDEQITELQKKLDQQSEASTSEREILIQEQTRLRKELSEAREKVAKLTKEVGITRALEEKNKNLTTLLQQEKKERTAEQEQQKTLLNTLQQELNQNKLKISSYITRDQEQQKSIQEKEAELAKLKFTLSLYERMVSDIEKKLEKKKSKELSSYLEAKEKLSSLTGGTVHYTRVQVGDITNTELYKKISDQETEIGGLKDTIIQKENQHREEIAVLKEAHRVEIAKLRAELEEQISNYKEQIQDYKAKVHELKAKVTATRQDLTASIETTQLQAKVIIEKDEEIKALREQVVQLTKDAAKSGAVVETMSLALNPKQRSTLLAISGKDDDE